MSGSKLSHDRLLGIIAVVIGVFVIFMAQQIVPALDLDEPGPKLFPMISGIGLIVCGLVLIFRKPRGEDKPFADKAGWIRMAVLFVTLMAYVFIGLEYVGYLISTPLLIMVVSYMLAEKDKKPKIWFCILFGLIVGLTLYFFFSYLKIQLPRGVILKQFGLKW